MQLLLIKINAIDANPEYALLGKKQEEDHFTPGEWSKVRSLTRGRRVLIIIPNKDVVLTSAKIPSKNKKQLLKAIPFALEDQLAEDIEDLHFTIEEGANEEIQVAVINRDLLDSYLVLLRKNNITPHFILPKVLVQTIKEDSWSVLQETKGDISVRLSEWFGFSCDESLLDIFLQQLEIEKPKLLLSNLSEEKLPEILQDCPIEEIEPNKVMYKSAISALPLNLLSNFISDTKQSNIDWKPWRPTMAIASIVAVTWLGILGWQNTLLQKQSTQLKLSIESIYKSTFPNGRIVDPPQQMASKLAQLKKSTGKVVSSPLPLIADISPLIKEYKDLNLGEIRFRENKLEIVVESPNLTRLEGFKKDAVEKVGLQVDIVSSTTTADKVVAILLISPLQLSQIDQEKA